MLKPNKHKMRPYYPSSWFHEVGVKKVVNRIKDRLPDVNGCLFITLTVDREQFTTPESAFDYTRAKIRKVFNSLKMGIQSEGSVFKIDSPYFVKVEFHEDGWPHYHIVFRTRRFLPPDVIDKLWPYGRTNVQRIKNKKFHYLLKYVTKGCSVPEWILSRKRLRIIQSGHGFYLPLDKNERVHNPDKRKIRKRNTDSTIGERIKKWEHMAVIEKKDGSIETVELPIPYVEFLNQHVLTIAQAGEYLGNGEIKLTMKGVLIWRKILREMNADSTFLESLFPAPRGFHVVGTTTRHS